MFLSSLLLLIPPHEHQLLVLTPIFTPVSHLLSQRESSPTWMSPTPATWQPLLLVSAPRAALLYLPPFPASVCLPVAYLGLQPGPYQPLRGLSVVIPSVSVCLRFSLSMCLPMYWHILVFGLCQVVICVRGQEAMAPPFPGSQSPWSSPTPLLGHDGVINSTVPPTPPPPFTATYPPCCLYLIPSVKVCGE